MYECAVYSIPLEDALTIDQWTKLASYFPADEQLFPIVVSENNTTIIGFMKNEIAERESEIADTLRPMAENWDLEPDGDTVTTIDGLKIAFLSEYNYNKL